MYPSVSVRRKREWCSEHRRRSLSFYHSPFVAATSSYVHVQPPAYSSLTAPSYGVSPSPSKFLFSAGGPTGEMHYIDAQTGALKEKGQEIIFLKGGEKDLVSADKTRKALRYGAHNVDIGPHDLAYIADVGRNSFLVYSYDSDSGKLSLLNEVHSPRHHDGPRHVVPSYTGKHVFMVTEHTSFVDVFRLVSPEKGTMKHVQRVSILPDGHATKEFRGDTVRLSPDGRSVFATTRGMNPSIQGYVKVWNLNEESQTEEILSEKLIYQTRNSGGKANAIEFAPRYASSATVQETSRDYAVLTDDQEGYISVLEWNGNDLQDVATIQLPSLDNGEAQGASQAVWIS
jgi:carboxy-cis,cis-muconate cyclase